MANIEMTQVYASCLMLAGSACWSAIGEFKRKRLTSAAVWLIACIPIVLLARSATQNNGVLTVEFCVAIYVAFRHGVAPNADPTKKPETMQTNQDKAMQ